MSDPVSSTTATLSGCTVTAPPPQTNTLAIDDRPLRDGNVGTDYANFVTDQAEHTATRQFTIVINAPRTLVVTSSSQLPSGTFGFTVRVDDSAGQ